MARATKVGSRVFSGKLAGGFRGIGLLIGPHRFWTKARQPTVWEWEAKNARLYFAAAKRVSTQDVAWRQGVLAEHAALNPGGDCSISGLWDKVKLFYHICHDLLEKRGSQTNLCAAILGAAISAYQHARVITAGCLSSVALFVNIGARLRLRRAYDEGVLAPHV